MKKKSIFLTLAALFWSFSSFSQKVNALAYYTDSDGKELSSTNISDGEAPLEITFRANPEGMESFNPSYEWHFYRQEDGKEPEELFVRYEEDTQYTFNESGSFRVVLTTRLEQDGQELPAQTITIAIAESHLEFPNAFSPNGDGDNDTYHAKKGWRSIVKFRAIIINRWGQKLYEWNDPDGGWDGKHNGHDVKEGVYFVIVNAKGADGREYNIRKDVNLIRGFNKEGGTGGNPSGK